MDAKARRTFGYEPAVTLDEGLCLGVAWLRQHMLAGATPPADDTHPLPRSAGSAMRIAWISYSFGEYCVRQVEWLARDHDVLLAIDADEVAAWQDDLGRAELAAFAAPPRQPWRQATSVRRIVEQVLVFWARRRPLPAWAPLVYLWAAAVAAISVGDDAP